MSDIVRPSVNIDSLETEIGESNKSLLKLGIEDPGAKETLRASNKARTNNLYTIYTGFSQPTPLFW